MLTSVGFRHQAAHVATGDIFGPDAEQPLRGGIERLHRAGIINENDTDGRNVEDRLQTPIVFALTRVNAVLRCPIRSHTFPREQAEPKE